MGSLKLFPDNTQYYGVLRITNPNTLLKWKANGDYDNLINQGYIYAEGCGRFRKEICTCIKCRKLIKKQNKTNEKI